MWVAAWCALRTVIWFNSAPLKSHPASIIIRLPVHCWPAMVNLRSIQKLTFQRQSWWESCTQIELLGTHYSNHVMTGLLFFLLNSDVDWCEDCLACLLNPILLTATTSLGGGFLGGKSLSVMCWHFLMQPKPKPGLWLNLILTIIQQVHQEHPTSCNIIVRGGRESLFVASKQDNEMMEKGGTSICC